MNILHSTSCSAFSFATYTVTVMSVKLFLFFCRRGDIIFNQKEAQTNVFQIVLLHLN